MKKKISILVLVFMLLGTAGLFAQEAFGFIKPTLSFGMTNFKVEDYADHARTFAFDVDFVHKTGFTLGTQNTFSWRVDRMTTAENQIFAFGPGYTFDAGVFSLGGKLMIMPIGLGGAGLNVNGTWWFMDSLGLTGLFDYYVNRSDQKWRIMSFRAGVSVKI